MGAFKIGVAFCILILVGAVAYAAWDYYSAMQGTVTSVDVYLDGVLWNTGDLVDWGDMSKGQTYSMNMSVENKLDIAQIVTVYIHGLPSAFTGMTWAENGSMIQAHEATWAWLNLTVAPTATGGLYTWSWNVTGTP